VLTVAVTKMNHHSAWGQKIAQGLALHRVPVLMWWNLTDVAIRVSTKSFDIRPRKGLVKSFSNFSILDIELLVCLK